MLGTGRVRHNGIGGGKSTNRWQVISGIVVNQTQFQIFFLPCEVPVCVGLGGGGAGATEGVVTGFGAGDLVATGGCQNTGAAQMVAENVKQAVVCGRWVANDAGGYGLPPQCVGGAAYFGGADHEVVEVGVGGHGAETNLPGAFANADKPVFVGIGLGVDVRVIMLL